MYLPTDGVAVPIGIKQKSATANNVMAFVVFQGFREGSVRDVPGLRTCRKNGVLDMHSIYRYFLWVTRSSNLVTVPRQSPQHSLFRVPKRKMVNASVPPLPNAPTVDFARESTWAGPPVHVGVIGGSGLYKLSGIEVVSTVNPITVSLLSVIVTK